MGVSLKHVLCPPWEDMSIPGRPFLQPVFVFRFHRWESQPSPVASKFRKSHTLPFLWYLHWLKGQSQDNPIPGGNAQEASVAVCRAATNLASGFAFFPCSGCCACFPIGTTLT